MSHNLEIPDPVFTRLAEAAEHEGTTLVGWIEQHLPPPVTDDSATKPRTLADLLGDSVGKFRSGGDLRASERVNELFGEYLEQKRREGRL